MNATTPPTDQAVRNYEEAQERFQLQLAKRQQAASDINFTNFAILGERTSRYQFSRSIRGKASREIPRLVIEDEEGQIALEGLCFSSTLHTKGFIVTEKTTFSCKDDCTLTKHTRCWTYSALRYFWSNFHFLGLTPFRVIFIFGHLYF